MAKKNDQAFDAFLADLEAINPQIKDLLSDDKVKTKLREGVLARADYSAQSDALRNERTQFEADVAEARRKIDGWQKWYGETSQEYATVSQQLDAYKEEFGDLTAKEQRQVARQQGMTVEQFEQKLNEEIQKHDVAALKFMDDLTEIKISHRENFKEKLDTSKVYEIAGQKGLPLDAAYNEYIADRVEEKRSKDFEERLKLAKEEGAREALSARGLPVVSNSSEMSHVLDVKDAPRASNDRIAAAVAAFNTKNR